MMNNPARCSRIREPLNNLGRRTWPSLPMCTERVEAVLIFDDTVQEKPYTDENEVMCWHHVGYMSIPVTFELIRKPLEYLYGSLACLCGIGFIANTAGKFKRG